MSGVHRAAALGFARSADAYERGRPGYPQEAIRFLVERLPPQAAVLFGPFEERVFEHAVEQDADGLEARVGSISFVAALDPAERARVLDGARAIAGSGTVTVPYRTEVQVARRL